MVNQTMPFTARRFLIFAALQFVVITRYYAALCLAKNKNQHTLNPSQLSFLGLMMRSEVTQKKEKTKDWNTTVGMFPDAVGLH
jgi:hypothetical protein